MTAKIAETFVPSPLPPPRVASRGGAGFVEAVPFVPSGPEEFVPMRLARRCGRKIVLRPNADAQGDASMSAAGGDPNPLAQAVARGFAWRAMMDTGQWANQRALAQHLGIDRSYVSRLIRLTLLAPDIIEAILDGREPSGLSIDALAHSDCPLDWPGQRRAFGFPMVN